MKIAVISGSSRNESNSLKVAQYAASVLRQQGVEAVILDCGMNALPEWKEENFGKIAPEFQVWHDALQAAEGVVMVCPEWHGMVPSALKNVFLHATHREFFHKPALIVSVSAGQGGSFPISELRTSSYKNSRIVYLPEHLIVRGAGDIMNPQVQDQQATGADAYLRKRLNWSLRLLQDYAAALKPVRAAAWNDEYVNGMS